MNDGLPMNLLGLTYAQVAEMFKQRYGKGSYHAAALYKAFFQTPASEWKGLPAFSASPRLRERVSEDLSTPLPRMVDRAAADGVVKLVFGLTDGLRIETVVIPMANHATVCISSQVGCAMGCRFCRTGRMGWRRNLTAAEIVSQVFAVKVQMGYAIRNVVFMGMGEPLDNFENVKQATDVLSDQRGLDIALRHITISTVGLPEGIRRLAALNWPQLKLAVSLNASNDDLRGRLMPVNRRYPLESLKEALRQYPLARGNALFMEYVLIKGVNDDPQCAAALAAFFRGLDVKLNLIAYNPNSGSPFEAPTEADLERFHQALVDQRIFVRRRSSKGAGILAACGQLGGGL
jgi:23S rRNA (adenine2503-C2)-methyltransferase